MNKAFAGVRGALKRGDPVELRCKKIWLKRVLVDLPGTPDAATAEQLTDFGCYRTLKLPVR